MIRVSFACALLSVLAAAQKTIVVDKNGAFNTVQSAVNAAKSGDRIAIKPGVYQEHVTIDKKALVLYGLGARPQDVLVHERTISAVPAVLTIKGHAANAFSHVANLSIGKDTFLLPGGPVGVDVDGGDGRLVFDRVVSIRRFRVRNFKGIVFFGGCSARASMFDKIPRTLHGSPGLEVSGVRAVVLNSCTFIGDKGEGSLVGQVGNGGPGVHATQSLLEIVHPAILGGDGGLTGFGGQIGGNGGAGLVLVRASARAGGITTDHIRGGNAPNARSNTPVGGAGAQLTQSTLEHSGITLKGGAGPRAGPVLVKDASSKVSTPTPALASIQFLQHFRIGRTATRLVHGPRGQVAVGLLGLGADHIGLPFGPLFLDLRFFLFPTAAVLDSAGQARWQTPLENDPTMVGLALYDQVVTIDSKANLGLGGAAVSVILN